MDEKEWTDVLDNIDVNTINKNRKCELILVVEKAPPDFKKLTMINIHSQVEIGRPVKCVSLRSLYDFVGEYKTSVTYVDNNIKTLINDACSEATVYLEKEIQIPVDLLIKLLKLKIICVIMEDIYHYQNDAIYRERRPYFQPPINANDKTDKKKGKGKDKGKSKKEKSSKKDKSKKSSEKPIENPCLAFQIKETDEVISNLNVDIEDKILYIALIGFHIPQIFTLSYSNNLLLTCVVEFQESDIKFEGRASVTSLESKDLLQDQYYLSKGVLDANSKQELYNRRKEILQIFWKRIYEIENDVETPQTFVMSYAPLMLKVQTKNSKIFLNQCELLYNHFADAMIQIKDYKLYYENYLSSLKIYNIPEISNNLDVQSMNIYKRSMDLIPNDCISIGVLLEFLIDEVCNNVNPQSFKTKLMESNFAIKESLGKDVNHHSDFRDQLKKTLEYNKCNNMKLLGKNKETKTDFLFKLNLKPYIIHETNIIEMSLKYYDYLPRRILDTWIKSLMKNNCLNLWQQVPDISQAPVCFKQEMKKWCASLEISDTDLYTAVNMYLSGQFTCIAERSTDINKSVIEEYFPVRNIQLPAASRVFPKIIELEPDFDLSSDVYPNDYEHVYVNGFKFEENLPAIIMLQELQQASENYECVDRQYVPISDSIFLRFHHKADDFGIVVNNWQSTIRTPVNLNDFLSYVIYEDTKFILSQAKRYRELMELRQNIIQLEKHRNTFKIEPNDFIIRRSIYKNKQEENAETESKEPVVDKKSKNKKETKSKDSKSSKDKTNKKAAKTKGKDKEVIINAREIVEGNKKIIDIDLNKLLEEPSLDYLPKLTAFNFNNKRISAEGSSTIFYSTDELKVVVNKMKILKNPERLSLTVGLNGNDLFIHRITADDDFAFHLKMINGTLVAFGKSHMAMIEARKQQKIYLMKERYKEGINCLSYNQEVKKKFILIAPILKKIIDMANVKTETLSHALESLEGDASNLNNKIITEKQFVKELKLLRENTALPQFKICSSRLHKYAYAKRIKSQSLLNLEQVINLFKRKKIKTKQLKLKTCYPVMDRENFSDLDIRFTLPNGLHIRNVLGETSDLCYINQFYFQKGPQFAPIANEKYRTFLRNGYVAIKRIDGTFLVYGGNGKIIIYEVPFIRENKVKHNCFFKRRIDSIRMSQNVLKCVRRKLNRLLMHSISGYRCNFKESRRSPTNDIKIYPIQRNKFMTKWKSLSFNFITTQGKQIKIDGGQMTIDNNCYVLQQDQIGNNQQKFQRQDGTIIMLNKEGYVQVTYSDGTRITSWYMVDASYVYIDLTKEFGDELENMGDFTYINLYHQFEHPNYATVIYGTQNSLQLLIPDNIIFEHNMVGYSLKIDNSTMLTINKGDVNLESSGCKKCNKKCVCYINLKPLLNTNQFFPSDILLKAMDTRNKIFIVNYDGSCKRTDTCILKKTCNDYMHKNQILQKYFILNRDNSGKLLWSEKMFRNRLGSVKPKSLNENIILYIDNSNLNLCTAVFKTIEKEIYNNQLYMNYLPIFTDDVKNENSSDTKPLVFIKQRILDYIHLDNVFKLFDKMKETTFDNNKFNVIVHNLNNIILNTESTSTVCTLNIQEPLKKSYVAGNVYGKQISDWKEKCNKIQEKINQHKQNKVYPYFKLNSESLIDMCDGKGTSKNAIIKLHQMFSTLEAGKEKVSTSVSTTNVTLDIIAQSQKIQILGSINQDYELNDLNTQLQLMSSPLLLDSHLNSSLSSTSTMSSEDEEKEMPSNVQSELTDYIINNLQTNYNTSSESLLKDPEVCADVDVGDVKNQDNPDEDSLWSTLDFNELKENTYSRVKKLFDPSLRNIKHKLPEVRSKKLHKEVPAVKKRNSYGFVNNMKLPNKRMDNRENFDAVTTKESKYGFDESLKGVTSRFFNYDICSKSPSSICNVDKIKRDESNIPYIRQKQPIFDSRKYLGDTEIKRLNTSQERFQMLMENEEVDDLKVIHRAASKDNSNVEYSTTMINLDAKNDNLVSALKIRESVTSTVSACSSTATITRFSPNKDITPSLHVITSICNVLEPEFSAVIEENVGTQTDLNTSVLCQTDIYYDGHFNN